MARQRGQRGGVQSWSVQQDAEQGMNAYAAVVVGCVQGMMIDKGLLRGVR